MLKKIARACFFIGLAIGVWSVIECGLIVYNVWKINPTYNQWIFQILLAFFLTTVGGAGWAAAAAHEIEG